MKFNRLGAFTLGVVITAVSVGAVSLTSAAGDATIKACANKKTGAMRYISKGACKKTETSLSWNQMGPQGLSGNAGAKGDTGIAGPKGDAGEAGPSGIAGIAGPKGDTGIAGASSPNGFTARSVCGATGTSLCDVGVQGPGGGTIFYVDTANDIFEYDYLEVAPTIVDLDDDFIVNLFSWAGNSNLCGSSANMSCSNNFLSDGATAFERLGLGKGRAATEAIVARHEADSVPKNSYAAGAAMEYTTATASDWFLPSKDELNELCKYAHNTGQEKGASTTCSGGTLRESFAAELHYLSSSESTALKAWRQYFGCCYLGFSGTQSNVFKDGTNGVVRPIRGF
jgi:hypothetical protein